MAEKDKKQGAAAAAPNPLGADSPLKTPGPETPPTEPAPVPSAETSAPPALPRNTAPDVLVASKMQRSIRFAILDNGGARREFVVAGRNEALRGKAHGALNESAAAFTKVPREAWEKILEKYRNFEALEKGLIWAAKSKEESRPELKTGFEPIDPAKTQTKAFDKKQ
jgi:hypothetical protein